MRAGPDRWPEFYGFSVWGRGPTYVVLVEKGSIADEAGLTPGDQILEVDGSDVSLLNAEEIKVVARKSAVKPPTLGVVSRIQMVDVPFDENIGGYGFALRSSRPIVVDSVNPYGPAFKAGLRKGDAILQVNGYHVSTAEVVNMLLVSDAKVTLGILTTSSKDGSIVSNSALNGRRSKNNKAKELYAKMNHLLGPDYEKKMAVISLMKQYAEDRDVAYFVKSLLETLMYPDEQQLLAEIRNLIPPRHISTFDRLVEARESEPSVTYAASIKSRRIVTIDRTGDGSFGFVLRGHNPVVVDNVEPDGSAARVGLRPGDCLLKLNGLDVSRCSHAHLVQLLQGSGSAPTIEVMHRPDALFEATIKGNDHQIASTRSGSSLWESSFRRSVSPTFTVNSQRTLTSHQFKDLADSLLTLDERRQLRHVLEHYKSTADIEYFTIQVASLFDSPEKRILWTHLLPKLPTEHRRYCLRHVPAAKEAANVPTNKYIRDDALSRAHSAPMLHGYRNPESATLPRSARSTGTVQLDHLGSFKQQLEYLLTSRERSHLKRALQSYATQRDVHILLEEMPKILDTPSKRTLWLYIIPLLSIHHQDYCRDKLKLPQSVGTSASKNNKNLSIVQQSGGDIEDDSFRINQTVDSTLYQQPNSSSIHPARSTGTGTASDFHWLSAYDNDMINPLEYDEHIYESFSASHGGPDGLSLNRHPSDQRCPHDGNVYRINGDVVDPNEIPSGANFLLVESEEPKSWSRGDSFDARAFRALKALDDAVDSADRERTAEDESTQENTNMAAVPPAPPMPIPAPPAPPNIDGVLHKTDGPVMNVKRLNWDKLEMRNLEGTLWGQISSDKALEEVVNFLELEDQFAMSRPKPKPAIEGIKQIKKICIINQKKAYNISILLAHLKLPVSKLRDALYEMNDSIYTPQLLTQLLRYAPDSDEIEKYDAYNGPVDVLSEADQLGYLMTRVAGYEQRLRAMLFKANFAEKAEELRVCLRAVGQASRELVSSRRLARVFELILAMGNFLNRGNSRIGGAEAFRISSLDKLESTKTSDGKSSLLHVLVDTVQNRYPDCINLRAELSTIPDAARVEQSGSNAIMTEELKELKAMIQETAKITYELMSLCHPRIFDPLETSDIEAILEKLKKLDESNYNTTDKFSSSMNQFLQSASDEIQELFALHADSSNHLQAMLKYFGEDSKTTSVDDIFATFARFLNAFERAHHRNKTIKRH